MDRSAYHRALADFEREFIPTRHTAGLRAAQADWVEQLPDSLNPRELALLRQGFEAGYDAAMAAVSQLLARGQRRAIQGDFDA